MSFNLTYQLKWSWNLSSGYRKGLLGYFLLELFGIGLSLLFILFSKKSIDIATHKAFGDLNLILIYTGAALIIGMFLRIWSNWLNERNRMNMLVKLQNKVIKSQMLATWQYVKKWHTGDVQVRVHNDCEEIVQMVSNTLLNFILTIIRLMASFGLLWVLDPMLALLILAITPLLFFSKIYFKKLRRLNRLVKDAESYLGQVIQENLRFRVLIRALGMHDLRWEKTEESQQKIVKSKQELLDFSIISQALMRLAVNVGFLVTFIWGVYKLHAQEITFGTLTAFLQLVGRIQNPILGLMAFVPVFIRFRTSLDRVQELLVVEAEEEPKFRNKEKAISISLNNISFRYDDLSVIEGVSFKLNVSEPTAIIGSSGKGKTTLIRLLLSLIQIEKGEISWISQAGSEPLSIEHRNEIAYVPQGDKLFSGSIRENLQIGKNMPDEEELREALYVACAEFVYELPESLETIIGESGYGLSEGQAVRIAIARALLRKSSVWLFDEITAALDGETSEILMERLLLAGKDKIMVFVTHDLNSASKCKQTIYI